MTEKEVFEQRVRVVPSANSLFPNGQPVTYSLITIHDYIGLAHGLDKCVAEHFAKIHNASLKPL